VKYAESVLDLVGDTPLVRLNSVTEGIRATVLAKVEYLNPGGSAKDRIALRIVEAAERDGLLRPGGTIVEPTSGNTGVGLALVAQQRGYRCVFVVPDKVGQDKRDVLTAYGAEVVVTPTAVAPDSPESYYGVSDRLAREIPGAFKPDQYSNPAGPRSHYETTGPEIWRDTEGRVTHFVAGVGTGGTISGVGRYLKEVSGGTVQVVGADPEGSIYSGGSGRPYLLEGVGEDFLPGAYDGSVVDRVLVADDSRSFALTRRLAREEGLLVGGSSGLAVAAALDLARELGPDDVVVVLLPDGGRGYLGKIFDDDWMRSYGFAVAGDGDDAAGGATDDAGTGRARRVTDVLAAAGERREAFPHARPEHTVGEVVQTMTALGVAHLPVLSADLPVVVGEVVGGVAERDLLDALLSGRAAATDPVAGLVGEPLPRIGAREDVEVLRDRLEHADALLVLDEGTPRGIVTRHDLLTHLSA